MHGTVELILNCASLWLVLQTVWSIFISVFYNFGTPCIIWGSLIIAIGLKLARIPQPNLSVAQEILGVDPLSLEKDNAKSKDHGNGEQYCMRVVAHRGGGYDYPENSLSAFRNCQERGCTAIEFDLSLTKDNVPIIFHDSTVDRVTGTVGTLKDMTWDQLKQLDITHNHPLQQKFVNGEKIPLFHEGIETCLSNEQRMIIDIKESSIEMVQIVLDTFKKYPKMYQRAIISSFNPMVVYMIRRRDPKIVAGLTWRPRFFSRTLYSPLDNPTSKKYDNVFKHLAACVLDYIYDWTFHRFFYYIVGVSVVLLHKDAINPHIIQEWHDREIRVMAWTVNLPSEKSHFSRLLKITYLTDTLLVEKDM